MPAVSLNTGFSLSEHTRDHQELHLHGSISFRIADPRKAAERLPFAVDPKTGEPTADGRQMAETQVIEAVQSRYRPFIQSMAFEESLRLGDEFVESLLTRLMEDPELDSLGIVVEGLHLLELTPAPELRPALGAEYREGLNKRADDAIYDRRFSAQKQEATLKKDKLDAEIGHETGREKLVERQTANQLKEAKAAAEAERLQLEPYASLSGQSLVGLALKSFAEQPQAIGQLNITPDLLSQLAGWMNGRGENTRDAA